MALTIQTHANNFRAGRNGCTIRAIVLHFVNQTIMSLDGQHTTSQKPNIAPPVWPNTPHVSFHYGVDGFGTVHAYVNEVDTAFSNVTQVPALPLAAGCTPDQSTINIAVLGSSLGGPGYCPTTLPAAQIKALAALLKGRLAALGIPAATGVITVDNEVSTEVMTAIQAAIAAMPMTPPVVESPLCDAPAYTPAQPFTVVACQNGALVKVPSAAVGGGGGAAPVITYAAGVLSVNGAPVITGEPLTDAFGVSIGYILPL
jgi:hypothetical protein